VHEELVKAAPDTADYRYHLADTDLAIAQLRRESGRQFDPTVVEAFNSLEDQVFERIAEQMGSE